MSCLGGLCQLFLCLSPEAHDYHCVGSSPASSRRTGSHTHINTHLQTTRCCCLQVAEAQIEYNCFQALQQQEVLAAPDRIERMKLLVEGQQQREAELQQRYRQLCQQRDDMREQLAAAVQQQQQGASQPAAADTAQAPLPAAS